MPAHRPTRARRTSRLDRHLLRVKPPPQSLSIDPARQRIGFASFIHSFTTSFFRLKFADYFPQISILVLGGRKSQGSQTSSRLERKIKKWNISPNFRHLTLLESITSRCKTSSRYVKLHRVYDKQLLWNQYSNCSFAAGAHAPFNDLISWILLHFFTLSPLRFPTHDPRLTIHGSRLTVSGVPIRQLR